MKKLLDVNNLPYKIIAFILALLLWLYVNHQENPTTEQIFTVPLEVRGLEHNLTISERPTFVKVRLQGQRRNLDEVTPRDIQAFLEMSGLDVGQHLAEVHVSVPQKTQLVSVTPSSVNLSVEVLATRQFPVSVSYKDNTPAEGLIALEPILTPSQVILSGPEDKLKEVKQVYVEIDLGDYTYNYNQKLPIKVEDDQGNLLLDWFTITPSQVEVLVPIISELPSRTVPVRVPVEGDVAAGYTITQTIVAPELIGIIGEEEVLHEVHSLSTQPVRIGGATQDVVRTVELILPEGVRLTQEVTVTAIVRIEKITEKTFTGLTVLPNNLGENLTVEILEPGLDISVSGPESLMEKLLAADLTVFMDLAGLPVGEYQVPVQVNLPSGVILGEINPAEITVLIEQRPEI
ncbi:MAG: YbbR-like domain-containing protein [Dehalobacterium sp.]|jgi:YbbR domain-containing protein